MLQLGISDGAVNPVSDIHHTVIVRSVTTLAIAEICSVGGR